MASIILGARLRAGRLGFRQSGGRRCAPERPRTGYARPPCAHLGLSRWPTPRSSTPQRPSAAASLAGKMPHPKKPPPLVRTLAGPLRICEMTQLARKTLFLSRTKRSIQIFYDVREKSVRKKATLRERRFICFGTMCIWSKTSCSLLATRLSLAYNRPLCMQIF